jgi:outer membrane lipoprotein-sorting protein
VTMRTIGVVASIVFVWMSTGAVAHAEPTIEELLNATDDVARGEHSIAVVSMQVKTARYERSMKMKAWSKGTEQTLIQILEPAKEKGMATLKVEDNIWNYLPKIDRTMKVPSGMMSGSWMGSHFSNDDLVKENRLSEEFDAKLTARPDGKPDGVYVIELVPKPEAPVVWGKVVSRVSADILPVDVKYYDEKGALVRTMSFGEARDMGGRMMPSSMTIVPEDKPGEMTRIVYEEMDFKTEIPDSTFSLQALKP